MNQKYNFRVISFGIMLLIFIISPNGTALSSEWQSSSTFYYICSDPHVGHKNYADNLLLASADFNQNTWAKDVEKIVILGDLVEYGENNSRHLPLFMSHIETFDVANWTYVLGNHDHDRDTGIPVVPPRYWSEEIGGIKLIFLSDESRYSLAAAEFVETEQFQWLMEELNGSPNQPKLIFSHYSPRGTPLEWFSRVNWDSYNVWAWIHGHHRAGVKNYLRFHGGIWETGINQLVDKKEGIGTYGTLLEIRSSSTTVTTVRLAIRRHDTQMWEDPHYLNMEIDLLSRNKPFVFGTDLIYIFLGGVAFLFGVIWTIMRVKKNYMKRLNIE